MYSTRGECLFARSIIWTLLSSISKRVSESSYPTLMNHLLDSFLSCFEENSLETNKAMSKSASQLLSAASQIHTVSSTTVGNEKEKFLKPGKPDSW